MTPDRAMNAIKRAAATSAALDDGGAGSLVELVTEVQRFHAVEHYAPSFADLAHELGWSKMRVRDAVRSLVESGHLTMKPGVGHSLRCSSESERMAARSSAWYQALRDLPAIEVAAARAALGRLGENGNGGSP